MSKESNDKLGDALMAISAIRHEVLRTLNNVSGCVVILEEQFENCDINQEPCMEILKGDVIESLRWIIQKTDEFS